MILIAFAIGFPVAYVWIQNWLAGFAYRMEINAWLFILPLGLIVSIGLLTIMKISLSAVRSNPVDSLQNE